MYRDYCRKREMQLRWMAKFGCSTSDLLIALTESKNTKTIYTLKNSGLIDSLQTSVMKQKIWYLTNEGRHLAAEWEEAAVGRGPTVNRFSSFKTLRHDLSLQAYVLKTGAPLDAITPEKCMPRELEHDPDAILNLDEGRIAIEIERTRKSINRVYRIFLDHARAIFEHRHYDKVRYVFPTDALAARYLGLFRAPDWPLFEYDPKRRSYLPRNEIWTPPRGRKGIDPKFQFLVMDDLL